jgi:hypothetical protein
MVLTSSFANVEIPQVAPSRRALRRLRVGAAVALLAVAALSFAGAGPASADRPAANHCIPPSGVDLNVLFGVSEQIVAPGSPSCTIVDSGERWRPSVMPWFVNLTFAVTPAGFVPGGATPLQDFVAKFTGVRYVVDAGSVRQITYELTNVRALFKGTFNGFPLVNPLTLAALKPLPVGDHTVATYWRFRAMHCDGFGAAPDNCFSAGETQLPTMAFTVTPGHD